jgi:hypothetical protein
MLFHIEYELFSDLKEQAQAYFADMSEEEIATEFPEGMTVIGRWHDIANGSGLMIADVSSEEALTSWMYGWSSLATFPVVKPVLDDGSARRLIQSMEDLGDMDDDEDDDQ